MHLGILRRGRLHPLASQARTPATPKEKKKAACTQVPPQGERPRSPSSTGEEAGDSTEEK